MMVQVFKRFDPESLTQTGLQEMSFHPCSTGNHVCVCRNCMWHVTTAARCITPTAMNVVPKSFCRGIASNTIPLQGS